ncbi:hypothetical protein [Sphingopyxis sp. KK2]|uniref:hypothetical protein n=1 Tax=Sphingopyxis sp. KK2 TaxID=1855727 RepID=UPI00097E73BB|nr:hypothetical protein [Sphingopyxis sp. KK2]
MLRYALPILPALLLAAPALAADDPPPLTYGEAARCGVLNSLMGVLEEGDAEKSRQRTAAALTWFTLAGGDTSLDEAGQKAAFDRVHTEEGEAVVALPAEGSARHDHMLTRLTACDKLRRAHYEDYRDTAEFLATADAAQFAGDAALARQGREPPPIPRKDLSFGDGWTFQSRGNNCTAMRPLGKALTLELRFTNFNDGSIWLSGKGLSPVPEDQDEALAAKHRKGLVFDEAGSEGWQMAPATTYANFAGTGLFTDGALTAHYDLGLTEDGATRYRLGSIQSLYWDELKAGKELRVKLLGKEVGVIPMAAAGGLWAEMQTCIDQYPDG